MRAESPTLRGASILLTVRANFSVAVAAVLAGTTSCAAIPPPDLGEPPSVCHMFAPEARLAWVGDGYPADYGLIREGVTGVVPGDIYVEASPWPALEGHCPRGDSVSLFRRLARMASWSTAIRFPTDGSRRPSTRLRAAPRVGGPCASRTVGKSRLGVSPKEGGCQMPLPGGRGSPGDPATPR